MEHRSSSDWRVAALLFFISSSIYFATISGITSSNDGSHYALVRALVERHEFEISPYLDFTEHQDYALRGDLRFSDRPPGTALMAAPLYALSGIAPRPLVMLPSKHDAVNPRVMYGVLIAPLAASAALVLFYFTLRRWMGRSQLAAVAAVIALGVSTTTWKYASVLYSHAPAMLVVWAAMYVAYLLEQPENLTRFQQRAAYFALGFTLGFAPLVEYTNVLFAVLVGLYALLPLFRQKQSWNWANLAPFFAGAAIPIAFLLTYNAINFGSPFELSTFNVNTIIWPQNEGFAADFATPLLFGLRAMLFYGADNQGMFWLSPISLLGLFGLAAMWRYLRRRAALAVGVFVMMLLIFSKSTTFNPLTNDGRYLTPFLGLWFIPLAFWLDESYLINRGRVKQFAFGLLFFGLLFISIRNQLVHIALSWNYDLDLSHFRPLAAAPENVAYLLQTVFPNAPNLPLLWLGEGLATIFAWLVLRWRGLPGLSRLGCVPDRL